MKRPLSSIQGAVVKSSIFIISSSYIRFKVFALSEGCVRCTETSRFSSRFRSIVTQFEVTKAFYKRNSLRTDKESEHVRRGDR